MISSSLAAAALLLTPVAATKAGPLRWVQDDWPKAQAMAKAEGRATIAVDVWATWCHTCLSMKHYVLTDPAFKKVADRHVWLALDYDLEENAAFFERYPVSAFPTFMVLDAKSGEVLARWAGSGGVEQMLGFFEHAKAGDDPLSRGQRALANKRPEQARAIFEQALANKGLDRARRTRLRLGWIEVLYRHDKKACALKGAEHLGETDDTSQGADYGALVAYCGAELEDAKDKRRVMKAVLDRLRPLAEDDKAPLAVDDRSATWGIVQMAYEALEQPGGANEAVRARLELLEAAAERAPDAAARSTFDYHRMQAYLHLGRSKDAIRMLTASEKAMPRNFNHPWRLAKVFLHDKRYEEGLEAIHRAIEDGYGGRKLRLYSTWMQIALAAGRSAEAKRARAEAKAHLAGLSPAQVRPYWRKEFDRHVARVEALP